MGLNANQNFNIPVTPEFHTDAEDVVIIHDCGVAMMAMRGDMLVANGATD